jgi:hypothetical protein
VGYAPNFQQRDMAAGIVEARGDKAVGRQVGACCQPSVEKSSARKSAYTDTPSIIVACIIVAIAALSI